MTLGFNPYNPAETTKVVNWIASLGGPIPVDLAQTVSIDGSDVAYGYHDRSGVGRRATASASRSKILELRDMLWDM